MENPHSFCDGLRMSQTKEKEKLEAVIFEPVALQKDAFGYALDTELRFALSWRDNFSEFGRCLQKVSLFPRARRHFS